MHKLLIAALALLASSAALAETQHYLRRDGNHVQHLKLTRIGDDISGSMDVNFEPNGPSEADRRVCSAEINGSGKMTGPNELTLREQIPGETDYCSLKIQLTSEGAKIEQSPECGYFVGGICHFASEGKELVRIK